MTKMKTQNSVRPHTEAKLQFYIKYLERYLRILLLSPYVHKINIYDMFCGAGVYEDGKKGSAVRAVDAIWGVQESNKKNTHVNLLLNDLSKRKVGKLKEILDKRSSTEKNYQISFSSKEASDLIDQLPTRFAKQEEDVRNLVFIDPYGYKLIKRTSLEALMKTGRTEIILFLPINQMYRFKNRAILDENDSYRPLREFIEQFDIEVDKISIEKEFIFAVAEALTFHGNRNSASYAIKNHTGHYYALFFVTSNMLGLQKIIEVKWELDEQQGTEFTGSAQKDFFWNWKSKLNLRYC